MLEYPTRPKFFANKVIRLLGKTCAAQEIGATGAMLVTWVAMTEDASGYRRAVTFFNGQLVPILGLTSERGLVTARDKAIESGWLVYEKGSKGRAGKYFVSIPDHAEGIDDAPSDEGHDNSPTYSPTKTTVQTQGMCRESAVNVQGNVRESGGNSADILPIPIPSPIPKTEDERETFLTGYSKEFEEWWKTFPVRVGKASAWKSYQAAIAHLVESMRKTDAEAQSWLLTITRIYADSPTGKGEFRTQPANWLDGRRWEDDQSEWFIMKKKPGDRPPSKIPPLPKKPQPQPLPAYLEFMK